MSQSLQLSDWLTKTIFTGRACRWVVCISLQLTIHFGLCAQKPRVVVELSPVSTEQSPVVLVKWYSADLIYTEGVNLYRRSENSLSWERLNKTPIVRQADVSPAVRQQDKDINAFVDLVKSSTPKQRQESIVLFNILLKSFQSAAFADFMGIYYEDRSVVVGTRYEYKVMKLSRGSEVLVGMSPLVAAARFSPAPPIEGLKVFQKEKTVALNWKHDEDRFYAVNIYRRESTDTVAIKLNKKPLILSQVPDSLGRMTYPNPMFAENVDLKEGVSYLYWITGVGFFGNETAPTAPVRVAFKDVTPPAPPRELDGKADSMKVGLNWRNPKMEEPLQISIHRSMKSDGPFEVITAKPVATGFESHRDSLKIPGPLLLLRQHAR